MVGKNTGTHEMITDNIIKKRKMGDLGQFGHWKAEDEKSRWARVISKASEKLLTWSIPEETESMWRCTCRKCIGNQCLLGILFRRWVDRGSCSIMMWLQMTSYWGAGSRDGLSELSWIGAKKPGFCSFHHQPILECKLPLGSDVTLGQRNSAESC